MHVSVGRVGLRLFLLNLYWGLFTILGVGIFGIGPSTKVLYQILMEDERDAEQHKDFDNKNLFKTYFKKWKHAFIPSNKLALPLLLLALFLIFEIRILAVFSFTPFDFFVSIVLQLLLFLIALMMINIFLFKLDAKSLKDVYKNSLILVLGQPLFSIGSFILLSIILAVYYAVPGLFFVFGISAIAYLEVKYIDRKLT